MAYKIKLPIFEGPFDLLIYLIRKNEVDIYDIPIAEITHQYLEYVELMTMLDLDIAGEFIEMVATLMLIKVRMLLPQPEAEGDEEIEDPRAKLVAQLIEYQQFKDAAGSFGDLEEEQRRYYARRIPRQVTEVQSSEEDELLNDVSLFDLLTAFKMALDNMPKVTVHKVNVIKVTIQHQVEYIFKKMENRPYALFREVTQSIKSKIELIVTFMAVLDLIRLHFMAAKQSDVFGEIRLIPTQELDMRKYLEIRDEELRSQPETEIPPEE
ncbi:MAG: segregation/condensation protein A [Calditrichia bacterium]